MGEEGPVKVREWEEMRRGVGERAKERRREGGCVFDRVEIR